MCATFFASSWKNSLAKSAILVSESSRHRAIELIWPLTFIMSLRMRCVRTVRALCLTRGAWSVNLQGVDSPWKWTAMFTRATALTWHRCTGSKVQGGLESDRQGLMQLWQCWLSHTRESTCPAQWRTAVDISHSEQNYARKEHHQIRPGSMVWSFSVCTWSACTWPELGRPTFGGQGNHISMDYWLLPQSGVQRSPAAHQLHPLQSRALSWSAQHQCRRLTLPSVQDHHHIQETGTQESSFKKWLCSAFIASIPRPFYVFQRTQENLGKPGWFGDGIGCGLRCTHPTN